MHIELWLMHRSCVPDCTRFNKSLHPGFLVPTIPSLADQILEICGFWCLKNQCATLRHQQHIAFHRTRPISPRHRKPPCCHPSTTHPAGGGAPSQGPDGARRSAGPRASGHPRIRLESRKASGGQRLLRRGEGNLGRLLLLLGPVLLGGDVDVGS